MEDRSEMERIKEAYRRRQEKVPSQRYSFFNSANLFMVQDRDWEVIDAFKRFGMSALRDMRILDVGCGEGRELVNLVRYGADPGKLSGVDLLTERIEAAKGIYPNIDFQSGSAEKLPFEAETFDIVMQFTVFTSILDSKMKENVAREMLRVLKPRGIILWYDYHMNNPRNPDVRGVKKKEIHALYPGCDISLKRITLAPPLSRAVAPCSLILCQLLEKLPFLCTHYLGIIKKR